MKLLEKIWNGLVDAGAWFFCGSEVDPPHSFPPVLAVFFILAILAIIQEACG